MGEAGSFSKWSNLPGPTKTLVVSKLDSKTRRFLRGSDRENHHFVDDFLFLNVLAMSIHLEEATFPDGETSYELKCEVGRFVVSHITSFESAEEMVDCLQKILKNIDIIWSLDLSITGLSAPIQLTKNHRKIKIETLHLTTSSDPLVVTDLLTQFEPGFLRNLTLDGQNIQDRTLAAFRLSNFTSLPNFSIDDAQFLNVTARDVNLLSARELTVVGLKKFLKKMLRNATTRKFFCTNLSDELQDLFDIGKRHERARVQIKPHGSNPNRALILEFTPENAELDVGLVPGNHALGNFSAELGPELQRFIFSIEHDL